MKKIYYLKTCDTCKRILKELNLEGVTLQEIKTESITASQLEEMYALSGSYEDLFSKRAQLYKSRGLKDQQLTEEDFKNLILETYTFLKRPVAIINDEIFIGNSKKNIEALTEALH
ncbi:ArsC/Spx/MgsR family protein [Flavicella sp.]|uniref:arsenate reductase family protein n=1 Tax=Flavicella sp. TaxID=2957742 RepID=UPI0026338EDB|nr:ArsC/Spx/MgsR family protein [Flavicella sp.]MDG1805196.1 ArsC/Spx/MgsR family protein [Flavicella sp.]MDG2279323.1 ArsC/Spx/MgsR family protein [Flavicella sp.]